MAILRKLFGKKAEPASVPIAHGWVIPEPGTPIFAEVTRQERINIKLSANVTKKNLRFMQGVAESMPMRYRPVPGDSYELDYNFDILYLDDMNKRLHIVLDMMDRQDVVIKRASLAEVTTGICLIKELFDKLVILQDKIPKVKGKSNKG